MTTRNTRRGWRGTVLAAAAAVALTGTVLASHGATAGPPPGFDDNLSARAFEQMTVAAREQGLRLVAGDVSLYTDTGLPGVFVSSAIDTDALDPGSLYDGATPLALVRLPSLRLTSGEELPAGFYTVAVDAKRGTATLSAGREPVLELPLDGWETGELEIDPLDDFTRLIPDRRLSLDQLQAWWPFRSACIVVVKHGVSLDGKPTVTMVQLCIGWIESIVWGG